MSEKADDDGGLSPTEEENAFWQNLDRRGLKVLIKKQYQAGRNASRFFGLQSTIFYSSSNTQDASPQPSAAGTHISHEIALGDFMTASPSREKPLVVTSTLYHRSKNVQHRTRLLPSGRHPRVASLAPTGQFTFSCQSPALRNRGLTDVGHRRRRRSWKPNNRIYSGEFAAPSRQCISQI